MKRRIPFFVFGFCMIYSFSCKTDLATITGNGVIVNKEIAIGDYQRVELMLGADVYYEQQSAKEPYCQINIDENILPFIEVYVKDNQLTIKSVDKKNISPSQFTIYTNSADLKGIKLLGSGAFNMKKEVNAKQMDIEIKGSGAIASDSLYCEKLSLSIDGSGKAVLNGAGSSSSLQINGSGSVNSVNFFVMNQDCHITGSGGMQVRTGEKLNVEINGSGKVSYKGDPHVNTSITGSGVVNRID
ncbi:MAG: DUF2807 domain-containing protein [Dysgonamonadaceae bacterium]|jgi:hypothetical protein|nr:DUF2807 domain-containing protein [Dysgonamonadaceae bacterium]